MRKKLLIFFVIVCIVCLLVLVVKTFSFILEAKSERDAILENYPNTKAEVEKIKYDMEITYHEDHAPGGYASVSYSDKINIKEKKSYRIICYYVWGSNILNNSTYYKIEKIDLTDNDIQNLIFFANNGSDEVIYKEDDVLDYTFHQYVKIDYQGKEKYYTQSDFTFEYDNYLSY